ncbi:hypothetical protein LIER_14099 [Lithospermum erythrorhizon]|uniref:Uncharacterized protein n=1 Tax=Lithospermum erythrorhizon TaxID=34254 RepID=A0AAV3PZU4_LITER
MSHNINGCHSDNANASFTENLCRDANSVPVIKQTIGSLSTTNYHLTKRLNYLSQLQQLTPRLGINTSPFNSPEVLSLQPVNVNPFDRQSPLVSTQIP